MKALQVSCEGLGNGGVQAIIMGIVKNITNTQFDIILFTNEKRFYEDEFTSSGGKIFRLPNYDGQSFVIKLLDFGTRIIRIFFGTYTIIKKNGPYDVIHCHNGLESGICLVAAYCAGIKIRITHSHRNDYEQSNLEGMLRIFQNAYTRLLKNLMLRFSNFKIACSPKAAQSLYGPNCLTRKDVLVIPNGVDLEKFSIDKYQKNKANESVNIINVGQYCINKNQLFIIELIPYLKNHFDDFNIKLIGFNDEYKEFLLKLSFSLGVNNYIEFIDGNGNIGEFLSGGDIFIFPSIAEGFGIALLEAQAMGLPCIVSDTVYSNVNVGLCEFLSLNETKEKWAETVAGMFNNRNQYKLDQMKLEGFSILNYAKRIENIYTSKSNRRIK